MCIRDRVYTAPLLPYKDQNTMLEELYAKFNVSRPDEFTGHILSVSDIVALRQNGVVSCHYVDSIGFQTGKIKNVIERYKYNFIVTLGSAGILFSGIWECCISKYMVA